MKEHGLQATQHKQVIFNSINQNKDLISIALFTRQQTTEFDLSIAAEPAINAFLAANDGSLFPF